MEETYTTGFSYKDIIKRYPPLPREEQAELLKKYNETKDEDIYSKLLLSNYGLVCKVAASYKGYVEESNGSFDFEDLVSEGILGVSRAIEMFDPQRDVTFATYACQWIAQKIRRFIIQRGATIRFPDHRVMMYQQVIKSILDKRDEKDQLRPISYEEIRAEAKARGASEGMIYDLLNYTQMKSLASFDKPIKNDPYSEDDTFLGDFIEDKRVDVEGTAEMSYAFDKIKEAIDKRLTSSQADVIKSLFGIGKRAETMAEIAKREKVSRQCIESRYKDAIRKLKASPEVRKLRA